MVLPASLSASSPGIRSAAACCHSRDSRSVRWLRLSLCDQALVRAGWKVNHKRVWRVMRQAGLLCRCKRRTVHTTDSKHSYQIYPNLVKELQVEAPNRCWVADLTYVRLPEGLVYLACLLNVYSRKCIGWSLSRRIDAQLPLQALEMALAQRSVSTGLIHHSDRGRQYCSHVYVERLLDVGANISMSSPGQPTENAFAESFIKTLSGKKCICISIKPLMRLKRACRRFWRMSTMPNVFTHR